MSLLIALHMLAAIVWVGGMFFAYMALRPVAAALLDPPIRLQLWDRVFALFFPWVWLAVITLPATGYAMNATLFDSLLAVPLHIQIMHSAGWVMIAIFLVVVFAPYRHMRQAIAEQDWPRAGHRLGMIRRLIGINLLIALAVSTIAAAGRYW